MDVDSWLEFFNGTAHPKVMDLQNAISVARRVLISLLISAHVLLLAFAVVFDAQSVVSAYLADTIAFSQVALLMAWAVFGNQSWMQRLALSLFLATYIFFAIDRVGEIHFTHAAVVLGVFWGARFYRFRIGSEQSRDHELSMQFSIFGLLILTGVAGLAITGVGIVRNLFFSTEDAPFGMAWTGVVFALVTVGVVLTMLRLKSNWLGAIVSTVVSVVGGLALAYVSQREANMPMIIGWMMTHGAVLIVSLWVLRTCGVRLVRVNPEPAKPQTDDVLVRGDANVFDQPATTTETNPTKPIALQSE